MKGFQRRSDFFPEHCIAPLSNFAAKRSKDSPFSSYLLIENHPKGPELALEKMNVNRISRDEQ